MVVPKLRKTVAFLSRFGCKARLFGLIADSLPKEIAVNHLHDPQILVKRTLSSLFTHQPLPPPDIIESIVEFDYQRKICGRPELATESFRNRMTRKAIQWYRFFQRELDGVDLLVVWNGYKRPSGCAVAAAKELGVKVLFCENGLLPGTLTMDPAGINFANSLTDMSPEFYRNIQMDQAKVNALLNTELQQRPLRRKFYVIPNVCDDDKPLPERYVLFAMQVHDDSQVLLFSPRFPSMGSVVPYVADRVAEYNRRHGDTLELVVKEHPSDFSRVDYTAMRAALPGVRFLRKRPVSEVIGGAAAVLTLNSTVGIEALLAFRPVITLGNAFYNVPGIVRHLESGDDLADLLAAAVSEPMDRELITRFLYFLRYEYLVPVSKKSRTSATIGPAVDRVVEVLHGQWPHWVTARSHDGERLCSVS